MNEICPGDYLYYLNSFAKLTEIMRILAHLSEISNQASNVNRNYRLIELASTFVFLCTKKNTRDENERQNKKETKTATENWKEMILFVVCIQVLYIL